MRNRIELPDLMYPIQSFFNSLRERDFLDALDSFAQGCGFSIEGASCSFPVNLSEDLGGREDQYGYIEFWTYSGNQEVRVSFLDFMTFLGTAADNEIAYDPKMQSRIEEKMLAISEKVKGMEDRYRKAHGVIT